MSVSSWGWAFHNKARQIAKRLGDWQVRLATVPDQPIAVCDVLWSIWWRDLPHLLARTRARKIIVGVHDHASWRTYSEDFKKIADSADLVLCGNPEIQGGIRDRTKTPVGLIEDSIDTGMFPLLPHPSEFVIGWCGNAKARAGVEDFKGVELLRRAAAAEGVSVLIQDYQARIPQERMSRDFYAKISAYYCGSVTEGGPNPVMEAMASGRPVITTRVGLTPRFVRPSQNGLFIERTEDSVRQAIRTVKEWRYDEALAVRCREAVLGQSWDRAVDSIIDLLADLAV